MAATGERASLADALGDVRLPSPQIAPARSFAQASDLTLPRVLPKWTELKAACRFFGNAKKQVSKLVNEPKDAGLEKATASAEN